MINIISNLYKKYRKIVEKRNYCVFIKSENRINNSQVSKKWNKLGFTTQEYYLYELNKNNYHEYLSDFTRWELRKLNGSYGIILDNQIVFNDLLANICKVPKILLYKNNGKYYNSQKEEIREDEIINQLTNSFIIKPCFGGGGKGVVEARCYNRQCFSIDLEEISIVSVLQNYNYCIVEDKIEQSSFYSKFYESSINTIRIVSINDCGSIKLTNAILRIGTKRSKNVDNASAGGIFSNIDINSGELSSALSYFTTTKYDNHPDTKQRIKGEIIPNWDYIKKKVVSLHNKIDYLLFVAWDIAILPDGNICVIEGNNSTGLAFLQCFGSLKDSELGNFLKKNGINTSYY